MEENALTLSADTDIVPGQTIAFRWNFDETWEATAGDETVIECWTGAEWADAFAVVDLFGERGGPYAIEMTDDTDFTPDDYAKTEGSIVIHEDARSGSYRVRTGLRVCEVATGRCDTVRSDARFTATRR